MAKYKSFESIKLGDIAKDSITGFAGVVVTRIEWLNGCNRINIQPRELKDGKPVEPHCFDWQQVEKVDETPVEVPKATAKGQGGPKPEVTRQSTPAR